MPMPSPLQPASPLVPNVVTPTPMQVALPLGKNAITAMAMATPQLYAGDPALTDIQLTSSAGCREMPEEGPTGPVATGTQAGHPAEAGSPTEASPTAPIIASAPVAALSKTAEAKEDLYTME